MHPTAALDFLSHRMLRFGPGVIIGAGHTVLGKRKIYLSPFFVLLASLFSYSASAFLPGENLLSPLPKGWKVAHTSDQKGISQIMEIVPENQTLQNWRRMITVQNIYSLKNTDPQQFAGRFISSFQATCPKIQVFQSSHDQNASGRPNLRLYLLNPECGKRPAESVLILVLKGNDALHVVQYAWRPTPPTPQELKEGNAYLDRIRFCDTRKGDCEQQLNRVNEKQ